MIDVRFLLFLPLVLLENKWLRATKTIMQLSDLLGVTQCQASVFWWQLFGEFMEIFEGSLSVDGSIE